MLALITSDCVFANRYYLYYHIGTTKWILRAKFTPDESGSQVCLNTTFQ